MERHTVQLSAHACRQIVEVFASKWVVAKTFSMLPCAKRIWDFPTGGDLKTKLEWSRKCSANAREAATVLEAFGVTVPELDLNRFLVPAKQNNHTKPGDLYYSYASCNDYRREIITQIVSTFRG